MSARTFEQELKKLSRASLRNFMDPGRLEWPDAAPPDAWYFTPQLVSLHDTPAWDALDEAARKRLSFFEAVNFFSLNIHGEKYLISEVSRRLHRGADRELSEYLLHFVEEEAKHMMYFSGFCDRYAGKVYPDRTLRIEAEQDAGTETFLLFARIYLFEEIVDEYNQTMARDGSLAPIAREINRIHHVEEARHLAFGRRYLEESLPRVCPDDAARARIRAHLDGYATLTWKQYYNPDAYRDAGIADPFERWQQSFDDPRCRAHRQRIADRRFGLLRELDLLGAGA